ncbi:hypothetical protein WR25_26584 [Diploscapter pachys]|uniref:Uncharacterized protein n=1 Tax=Diploscapter pachys TaxID=2018661 RepID=A0A2A2M6A9_9BILA|nr:hypothetical protein WR25_26584 [Diploscapter pachys]
MIVGDSIAMPSAISTVATTRSMTMKGRNIRKPIWNAVFSSDGPDFAMSANIVTSLIRVCLTMKACSGAPARSIICVPASWPAA